MKNILLTSRLLIALCLVSILAVGCNTTGYVVKGYIGDSTLFDRNIYLCDAFSENSLDTTVIAQDGTFEFKGDLGADAKPFLARLVIEFSEVGTVLIVENGKIDVNIDFVEGSYIPVVKGTPLNEEIRKMDEKAQVSRDSLMTKMSALESDITLTDAEASEKQHEYIDKYISDFRDICNEVFTQNKDNVVGLFALLNWASIDQNINLDSLVNVGGDIIKENEAINMQLELSKKAEATKVGNPYIDVTGVDNSGNKVSLSQYVGKGKLVLVDFWASWCGPCKGEIPNLAQIVKKYGKYVTVVGLNVWDQPEEFKKACKSENITWPQIVDENQQEFAQLYGVDAIPQILLIGYDGTILERGLRGTGIEDAVKKALSIK